MSAERGPGTSDFSATAARSREKGSSAKTKPEAPKVEVPPGGYRTIPNSRFEGLAEKVPHSFVGDLGAKLQRVGLDILNKPKLGVLEKLYQWRSGGAAKAEATFNAKQGAVQALEAQLARNGASVETVRGQGLYTPALAAKMDKERNKLLVKIEQAKVKQDAAHLVLEKRNHKKAHWDNRQKNIANGVIAKVEQATTPFVVRFDALKEQQKELNTSMASLQKTKEAGQNGLREFEAKLRSKQINVGERAMLKMRIEGIKDCIKRIDTEYAKNRRDMLKVEKKMSKVNARLGKWNIFKNEYARVGENRRYAEPGAMGKARQEKNKVSTYSHMPEDFVPMSEEAPEKNEEAEVVQEEIKENPERGVKDSPEKKEGPLKTTFDEYMKRWRKKFGGPPESEGVNANRFRMRSGMGAGDMMPLKDIEHYFKNLLEKDMTGGKKVFYTQGKITILEPQIDLWMKEIRDAFEKERKEK